jgi:hypothetical protein
MTIEIIIEDGTAKSDANSYISLEDAEKYFATRLNSGIWSSATDEDKSIALIMATRALDNYLTFRGIKYSVDQSREFPRLSNQVQSFLQFSEFDTIRHYLTFPKAKLEEATCEQALFMLREDVLIKNDLDGVKVLEVTGSVHIETFENKNESAFVPNYIYDILSQYAFKKNGSGMIKMQRG